MDRLWIASMGGYTVPLLVGAGTTAYDAVARFSRAAAHHGHPMGASDREEVSILEVDVGRGYVLAGSDALWPENHADPEAPDLEGAWSAGAAPLAPVRPFWMASAATMPSFFLAQGFGDTAGEALGAMLSRWVGDHCRLTGADPTYFSDERENVRMFRVEGSRSLSPDSSGDFTTGADPALEAAWDAARGPSPGP